MKQRYSSPGLVFKRATRLLRRHAKWLSLFMFLFLLGQSAKAEDLIQVYRLAQKNDPTFQSDRYKHEPSSEIPKQAYAEQRVHIHAPDRRLSKVISSLFRG